MSGVVFSSGSLFQDAPQNIDSKILMQVEILAAQLNFSNI